MNFDSQTHLDAATRTVSPHDRQGKPAAHVTLSRIFDVNIDVLWNALTNPDRISRWSTNVTGDLKLNGHYQIENNASGTITECEPQAHIALIWEFAGDVSWVQFRFDSEAPEQTRLTLTHTSHLSPHWDTYGPGATGVGWETAFLGLALYTSDPNFEKPDEMEFATSTDGTAFITGSSNGWAQANIDANTDPEKAQAAADQTTAFYTGQTI